MNPTINAIMIGLLIFLFASFCFYAGYRQGYSEALNWVEDIIEQTKKSRS